MRFSETVNCTHGLWSQLEQETGARYHKEFPEYFGQGGLGCTVRLKAEEWSIWLEAFKTDNVVAEEPGPEQIRMRAPYLGKDEFRFAISRKGLFTGIGKFLGAQDIEIGDPLFDDEFVIKGNDEVKVRALFANPRLKQLIRAQPYVSFQIRESDTLPGAPLLGAGGHELYFSLSSEQAEDLALLKSLFELFRETFKQLRSIGSA